MAISTDPQPSSRSNSSTSTKLEIHYIAPTPYVPNSQLPIVIYRNVIPDPDDHDGIADLLRGNGYRVDGFYGCYDTPHYHTNTVECYAFVHGHTSIRLGQGPRDADVGNVFSLRKGDVFVQPVCLQEMLELNETS